MVGNKFIFTLCLSIRFILLYFKKISELLCFTLQTFTTYFKVFQKNFENLGESKLIMTIIGIMSIE